MRKRGLTAGIALILGLQGTVAAQGGIGLKAGASFGDVSSHGVLPGNLSTPTGGAGGLYLTLRGGLVGVGVEALYAQRGMLVNQTVSSGETRLTYLDLPAYLKVTLPTPGIKPFVYAGAQFSYELKCRTGNGGDCARYGSPDPKRWDYAAVIGGGVRFGGGLGFGIEGRYLYGLRNLSPSTVTSGSSYRTRGFMLLGSLGH